MMNEKLEKEELVRIGKDNIVEMILLADDVLNKLHFPTKFYNEKGISIFDECDNESADKIKEKISHLNTHILRLFRKGAKYDTDYCADDSVDDTYLLNLFAMRVRDRKIVFDAQRIHNTSYLLLWGYNACHDGDEWVGIYTSSSELRKAYLNERKKAMEEPDCFFGHLMIMEFDSAETWNNGCMKYHEVMPSEIWGCDPSLLLLQ